MIQTDSLILSIIRLIVQMVDQVQGLHVIDSCGNGVGGNKWNI